ncbi:hypothetical protein JCM8097_007080 [Rhodosporidiobolus ruineniae]
MLPLAAPDVHAAEAAPIAKRRRSATGNPANDEEGEGDGAAAGALKDGGTSEKGGGRYRRTQRAPLSCQPCARRKIKCSKTTPCVQCLARGEGDLCKREEVLTRRGTVLRLDDSRDGAPKSVWELLAKLQTLEAENARLRATLAAPHPAASSSPALLSSSPTTSTPRPLVPQEQREFERVATALNLLELGRDRRDDHISYSLPTGPNESPSPPSDLSFDTAMIPSPAVSCRLLTFALYELAWLYSTYHGPTMLQQHQHFVTALQSPGQDVRAVADVSSAWLAFYFACLALAAAHLPPSMAQEVRLEDPRSLGQVWFDSALACLEESDFLTAPSILACQAICTLSHVFHLYGSPVHRNTLLAVAIRSAQQLGVHLLNEEVPCEADRPLHVPCTKHGALVEHLDGTPLLIEREVRRRLWWMLLHLEWVTVPIGLPFAVAFEHLEVPFPSNLADIALSSSGPVQVPPLSIATSSSFHIARSRLSRLMGRFHGPYRQMERDDPARLALVRQTDDALLHFLDEQPFFRPEVPVPTEVEAWLPQARILLRSLIAHQRLLVYRDYFALSFTNSAHGPARVHCLDQARAIVGILHDAQQNQSIFAKMATHWLAAVNILALDYRFASSSLSDHDRYSRRAEIDTLLSAIRSDTDSFEPHALHVVNQIQTLLAAVDPPSAPLPFPTLDVDLSFLPPAATPPPPPLPLPATSAPPISAPLAPYLSTYSTTDYGTLPSPANGSVADPALLAFLDDFGASGLLWQQDLPSFDFGDGVLWNP